MQIYKSFLTLSSKPAAELLTEMYQERWSIEDFFNFDGAMGFDRASTFIVTCYNAPKELFLQINYQGLPAKLILEGINPKIPWLYDYKLDFRFK